MFTNVCILDDIEEYVNQEYISKKFEIGPTRLWGDIINKISNLVFNSNMTKFKFDDFLQVLSILNKYLQLSIIRTTSLPNTFLKYILIDVGSSYIHLKKAIILNIVSQTNLLRKYNHRIFCDITILSMKIY